jgi:hypothetical protein
LAAGIVSPKWDTDVLHVAVANAVAKRIISGEVKRGDAVKVDAEDGAILIE